MSPKAVEQVGQNEKVQFVWSENPSIQELLDIVVCIVAEEYIQTVRQNPETFREIPASAGMTRGEAK